MTEPTKKKKTKPGAPGANKPKTKTSKATKLPVKPRPPRSKSAAQAARQSAFEIRNLAIANCKVTPEQAVEEWKRLDRERKMDPSRPLPHFIAEGSILPQPIDGWCYRWYTGSPIALGFGYSPVPEMKMLCKPDPATLQEYHTLVALLALNRVKQPDVRARLIKVYGKAPSPAAISLLQDDYREIMNIPRVADIAPVKRKAPGTRKEKIRRARISTILADRAKRITGPAKSKSAPAAAPEPKKPSAVITAPSYVRTESVAGKTREVIFEPNPGPQTEFLAATEMEVLFGGAAGGGKGLPYDGKVLTPFGYRKIGEMKVGDSVCAVDGSVTSIIAYHKRGVQPTYKLRFSDGTVVTCDGDHLWSGSFHGAEEAQIELITAQALYHIYQHATLYFFVPLPAPVFFEGGDTVQARKDRLRSLPQERVTRQGEVAVAIRAGEDAAAVQFTAQSLGLHASIEGQDVIVTNATIKQLLSIERAESQETFCISVKHASSLFMTDGCTVTHNSYAMLADPMRYFSNGNFAGLLLRRTNDELRELIWKSQELYPRAYPNAKWSERKSQWTFPSGARLWFTYLERDEDVLRYQGQSFSWVGIDELTQYATPYAYNYLRSRLRTTDPTLPLCIRASTNPGGPGHGWVKKMFVDPAPPGRAFWATDIETGEILRYPRGHAKEGKPLFKRRFIPSVLSDNPYLARDGVYEANLLSLPEAQRRQLLYGDWSASEGAAFQEFNSAIHVCAPFDIPPSWRRFRSCDFGYAAYSAVHWFAIDPQYGTLYVYRELYINKKTAQELARLILTAEYGESISYGVLDSSCWHQRGHNGPSIAEEMIREGCRWRPSDRTSGSRVAGKNRLHQLLRTEIHADGEERPGIIFFDTCRQVIADLPIIPADKHGGDDIDDRFASDHTYDSVRYGIMSRPRPVDPFANAPSRPVVGAPADPVFGY